MSDDARAIAKKYGARLVPAPDPKEAGFDEARNATLPHCTMDWIFWIDSDERLLNSEQIHKYLRPNIFHGYGIKQHHFSVDANFNPDLPVRLFRNFKGMRFWGSCHEHPEKELNKGPGPSIVLSDVHIAHVGYLNESVRRERFGRNVPLMNKSVEKYPNRLLNKFFTIRDNMIYCRYIMEQTGGRFTAECRVLCEQTVKLYRENFCGKAIYMSDEAMKYYSDACRLLGLGAEVVFAVNSQKAGTPKPDLKACRFASVDDLVADLTVRARRAMEPFCNPMW